MMERCKLVILLLTLLRECGRLEQPTTAVLRDGFGGDDDNGGKTHGTTVVTRKECVYTT